jgi:hypothetical protein
VTLAAQQWITQTDLLDPPAVHFVGRLALRNCTVAMICDKHVLIR